METGKCHADLSLVKSDSCLWVCSGFSQVIPTPTLTSLWTPSNMEVWSLYKCCWLCSLSPLPDCFGSHSPGHTYMFLKAQLRQEGQCNMSESIHIHCQRAHTIPWFPTEGAHPWQHNIAAFSDFHVHTMHIVKWELWLAGAAKLAWLAMQFRKLLDKPHNGQEPLTSSSICFRLITIDVKHQKQKQFREKRVHFLFQVSARPWGGAKTGSWRRNHRGNPLMS